MTTSGAPRANPIRRRLPTAATSALLSALVLHAGTGAADDTEIYFGRPDPGADTHPNVLFVLDTSGSMAETDGEDATRLERMKVAVKDLLQQADALNVGLMQFNSTDGGGPILYPVTNIEKEVCLGAACDPTVLVSPLASDADDVQEYVEDGNDILVGGNAFELIDTDRGKQVIGLRFTGLDIPRGATILDARLQLSAYDSSSGGNVTIDIRSENTGDAEPFEDTPGAVTDRSWHLTRSSWSLGDWTEEELYSSDNLASIVSQVTDRGDWCGGNALALRLEHKPGSTASTVRNALTFRSATGNGPSGRVRGQVPTLKVTYRPDALSSGGGCTRMSTSRVAADSADDAEQYLNSDKVRVTDTVLDMPKVGNTYQRIGVRFPDLDIPQGATVRRASIDFHVQSRTSGSAAAAVSVSIRGQNDNDAARFRNKKRDISKRSATSASALWSDVPNPAAGTTVTTVDLAPVVQEIVDRGGWRAGNAMAFLFTHASGSGTRAFTTHDADRSRAPRLTIEYDDEAASTLPDGDARTVKVRDELVTLVDSLVASGGTPIVDSLWEASKYFRGGTVEFGTRRGTHARRYNRVSHPDSYTGGQVVRSGGCSDDDLNATACEDEVITGNAVYVSPMTSSCQTNHIVFLSDGEATSNSSRQRIRDLVGASSCEAAGHEACGVELTRWLHENDLSSSVRNRQTVKTHTIAFNLDDPTFLRNLATAGGGRMYEASNSAQLLGAFRRIIAGANAIDTTFTAPGAAVNQFNRLTHRDDIYFAMFQPDDAPRWSGNLKRFRIGKELGAAAAARGDDVLIRDRDGEPAVDPESGFFAEDARSFWVEKDDLGRATTAPDGHDVRRGGAAGQLPRDGLERFGTRRAYTWVGSSTAVPSGGVALSDAAQALHEDNDAITDSVLGIGGVGNTSLERALHRRNLLAWARGVDVQDEDGDGLRTDIRRHLGDPMHSRPVIVNYAEGEGQRSVVFVATNEGFLHAFDTEDGEEQFAFMPGELLGNLHEQFENEPAVSHLYGLDGAISLWRNDTDDDHVVDAGEQVYLFVGMRRGGNRYYALDVSTLDEPRLAWAIRGGENGTPGFEQLGQTWSRMTPVRMSIAGAEEDVLIFGGGYDTEQDDRQTPSSTSGGGGVSQYGRGMFIVRATDGELLWSGLGANSGSTATGQIAQTFPDMVYPMPGNLRAIDVNRDGLVDQIYAADTGGQVWRFDPKAHHESGDGDLMSGGVIAKLADTHTRDRRRFYAEPDVALVERDGERFLTVSIGSGWRAHPLDEAVEDRFYVLRQAHVRSGPGAGKYGIEDDDGGYRPITDDDLVAVAGTLDPVVGDHGWYLDFQRSGEKVLGASVTFDNSVIFSSYVPDPAINDCSTGVGGGRAYVLDIVSGAPKRDLDGDGDVDADDASVGLEHEGLPPDAMILITADSGDEPEILFGSEQLKAGIRNETRRTFWSDRGQGTPIEQAESEEEN